MPASSSRAAGRRLSTRLLVIMLVFTSVTAAFACLVDAWLTPALGLQPAALRLWRCLLLAAAVGTPVGLLAPMIRTPTLQRLLAWPGLILMGWFSSLVILSLLRELALMLAGLLTDAVPAWRESSAQAVLALSLLASLIGYVNARRVPALKRVSFPTPRIGPALDGLRIVQLSDIHVGPTIGAAQVRRMVAACNRVEPDLVVITGDVVDGPPQRLGRAVSELGGLRARHGVFMVPGNHDYYSGIASWLPVFAACGVDVLLNAHRAIAVAGEALYVAGVTDHSAHRFVPAQRSSAEAALRGIPADAPVLMLAHQPVQGRHMPSRRIMLQLSGHTHGGQFFPWGWLVPLQQPITAGLSRRLGHAIYVSRGTGYWGPPKRLLSPAEITVITLRADPHAPA